MHGHVCRSCLRAPRRVVDRSQSSRGLTPIATSRCDEVQQLNGVAVVLRDGRRLRTRAPHHLRACVRQQIGVEPTALARGALPNLGELRVAELHDSDAWAGSLELDVEHRVELDAVGSHAGLAVNAVEESHSRHGHRHVDLLEP